MAADANSAETLGLRTFIRLYDTLCDPCHCEWWRKEVISSFGFCRRELDRVRR
jgi:hypothetical protein